MRYFLLSLLMLGGFLLPAQDLPDRLTAYFSFDDCDGFDESGNGSAAALVGNPDCVCGVREPWGRILGTRYPPVNTVEFPDRDSSAAPGGQRK